MTTLNEAAGLALPCLDLTNLEDGCTAEDVEALCARAQTAFGPTAAVCIWPRFVSTAKIRAGRNRGAHRHGRRLSPAATARRPKCLR